MSPTRPAPGPRDDERRQRVLAVVDSIPRGRVATYGQVAAEAGLPRRARLVGKILATLPSGSRLPWHRVVNAAGTISLRPGAGASVQRGRLRREGVRFSPAGRIDLGRHRWTPDALEPARPAPTRGAGTPGGSRASRSPRRPC